MDMEFEVWIYQNIQEENMCITLMHFMGITTGGSFRSSGLIWPVITAIEEERSMNSMPPGKATWMENINSSIYHSHFHQDGFLWG